TPERRKEWEPIGRAADDFQVRSGGKCIGHSLIAHKALGDRVEFVSYYAIYERSPMRVRLLFYKYQDKWTPIGLRIDSTPGRWLEEASWPQQADAAGARDTQDVPNQ